MLTNELSPSQQRAFDQFLEDNPQPRFQIRLLNAMSMMPVLDKDNIKSQQPWFGSKSKKGEVTFASPEGQRVHFISGTPQPRQQNGQTVYVTEPENIMFEASSHGSIEIPRNDHVKLIRFLFSDECRNSINPAKVEPLTGFDFELVQPEKTAQQLAEARAFIISVQGGISQNTDDENKLIAQRMSQVNPALSFDYRDPNNLRMALFDLAQDKPEEVYRHSTDVLMKALALTEQAASHKLIRFVHETREWVTEATGKTLLSVPSGDPGEGLAAWLVDIQGSDARRALQKQVSDAEKGSKSAKTVKAAPAQPEPIPAGMKRGRFGRLEPIEDTVTA